MIDAGVLGEDEKFELIEGEIVPVSPSRDPHERMKSALVLAVTRWLPDDLWFGVQSSIYLSEKTFVEPDLCVFRKALKSHEVKGPDVLLAIEVADSSLTFDRGTKALLYASHGVRESCVGDRCGDKGDVGAHRANRRRLDERARSPAERDSARDGAAGPANADRRSG
jgi:Putative restriction endonuclease